ncbi:MAG: hypothetical protein CFE21_13525 [Bacteroidetes bacterium B1(2017)]|nr:MAG: hypothetical protein CFE21_13525 [Bacteroidetes bacterium B1(2017)]
MKQTSLRNSVFLIALLLLLIPGYSCSLYKISYKGKTMFGSNCDAYWTTTKIWFEPSEKSGEYGAAFIGSRMNSEGNYAPQTGMNEEGLAFTRNAVETPLKELRNNPTKTSITNESDYLRNILKKCKTVVEAKQFIEGYNFNYFSNDVFVYVDKSGSYLIVEPDTLYIASENTFALANFCPSTTDLSKVNKARYLKGKAILVEGIDTSINYCRALSDSMHVCRKWKGDGTLYTNIFNIQDGLIYLYFYHDYSHEVRFILKEELDKGKHLLALPSLFPTNKEYEELIHYYTPRNSKWAMESLVFLFLILFVTSLLLLVGLVKKKHPEKGVLISMLASNSILLFFLILVGIRNEYFYMQAPYQGNVFSMLDVASYTPFLVLFMFIYLGYNLILKNNLKVAPKFQRILFWINLILYLICILIFTYWGLYAIY